MLDGMREHVSAPLLLAFLALFAALGGAAIAAKTVKKNTVVTKSIKNGAVKSSKIKDGAVKNSKIDDGAVTGGEVADGSLTGADLAADTVTAVNLAGGAVPTKVRSVRIPDGSPGESITIGNWTFTAFVSPGGGVCLQQRVIAGAKPGRVGFNNNPPAAVAAGDGAAHGGQNEMGVTFGAVTDDGTSGVNGVYSVDSDPAGCLFSIQMSGV